MSENLHRYLVQEWTYPHELQTKMLLMPTFDPNVVVSKQFSRHVHLGADMIEKLDELDMMSLLPLLSDISMT